MKKIKKNIQKTKNGQKCSKNPKNLKKSQKITWKKKEEEKMEEKKCWKNAILLVFQN